MPRTLLLKVVVKCLCRLVKPQYETAGSVELLMSPMVTCLGFVCKQSKVADRQAHLNIKGCWSISEEWACNITSHCFIDRSSQARHREH